MTNKHLSEAEIQQYAMNKTACSDAAIGHVESCAGCRMQIATYRLLFEEIKQDSKPTFDFDLPGLVLEQLPKAKPGTVKNDLFPYFLVFILLTIVAVPGYLFWGNIAYIFAGVSTYLICGVIFITIGMLSYNGVNMYRNYQRKMDFLNYS